MKGLLLGILFISLIGIGGLIYRNVTERPVMPLACQADALVCPDGTSVSRIGSSCEFPACPPPNVSLPDADIAFAIPAGYSDAELPDAASFAAYESDGDRIVLRRYAVTASSTPLAVIQETAIGDASGLPVPATAYSSTIIGTHRFTVVRIGRFEGLVITAYYLARGSDVLRFDAIDADVNNWTDPGLDILQLPGHQALRSLLSTLQDR